MAPIPENKRRAGPAAKPGYVEKLQAVVLVQLVAILVLLAIVVDLGIAHQQDVNLRRWTPEGIFIAPPPPVPNR